MVSLARPVWTPVTVPAPAASDPASATAVSGRAVEPSAESTFNTTGATGSGDGVASVSEAPVEESVAISTVVASAVGSTASDTDAGTVSAIDSAGVSAGADVSAGSASADVGAAERFFDGVESSSAEALASLSSAAASRSRVDDASASERRVDEETDPGSFEVSVFLVASLLRVDESADCDESCPADRLVAPLLSEESVSAVATP
ncbi:hypothetical protein GCM10027535_34060 [Mycolicibacterium hippocampi]|uniref:Uncharacterized protein n=1 Tax=Mycolicibacterium hippocampi TaxID=659824 RepID=A0A7I9ZIY7_9MYCO|nr:hypothetical protein MHIP_14750 [Mycolicibacterium hippocampi]